MKKFKLSKKSLMSFALSAIMLVSMSSMAMLCYAWDHPTVEAFNVTLYPEQYKTYSGAMKDTVVKVEIAVKNNNVGFMDNTQLCKINQTIKMMMFK